MIFKKDVPIPKCVEWMAQDRNGVWWGYEFKPTTTLAEWVNALDHHPDVVKLFEGNPNKNWKNELYQVVMK